MSHRDEGKRRSAKLVASGALLALVLLGGTSQAAVIRNTTVVDFTNTPVSFGYNGDLDFTLSNTGDSFFGSPVAVSTSGGGAVRTIFGAPSVDFDPPRNYNPYDSSLIYSSFSSPTPISYSGPLSLLGLADRAADGIHYGYAEFYQNTLVSFAFQSTPGVGILAPVPLPSAAPLFGASLVVAGAIGYGLKRKPGASA